MLRRLSRTGREIKDTLEWRINGLSTPRPTLNTKNVNFSSMKMFLNWKGALSRNEDWVIHQQETMNELEMNSFLIIDCGFTKAKTINKLLLRDSVTTEQLWHSHQPHPSHSDYRDKLQEIWFMQFTHWSRCWAVENTDYFLDSNSSFSYLAGLSIYPLEPAPRGWHGRGPGPLVSPLTSNFRFLCGCW